MTPEVEAALRLVYAAVLGAVIGFQRERHGKPAGLRTHILICLGAALFTVVSIYGFSGSVDPSRVAAGIVTGIGFIGAGVIFRGIKGDKVVGITTAASVWVTAAIGIAAGVGMYVIAGAVTIITFFVLMLPTVKG
jgi:putative Mg2+ transporter-C (MgtC) family protein